MKLEANAFEQELEMEKERLNKNINQLNLDIQNLCSQKEVLVKEHEVPAFSIFLGLKVHIV